MLEDVHREDWIESSDGSDADSDFIEEENEVPEIIDGQSDDQVPTETSSDNQMTSKNGVP